ncbi:hypothetical protein FLO80_19235 [Aquicoccus porphyridii]|uniref:Uncharacterized protein n=1 Tax=Aquicoccus porphyridii TaxID=1852029 RepID=A0A5A9YYI3_9RHOB|nr:hypothetical protein [Aquicoccus porphyridii]KAA0909887.1 hypothetical protein FLO80_19235 [Aquicoccus porphyridii]RAI52811.1 hypothetical protein DOO74_15040 [Rhodobacteraceae bacterium AsT-22]
MQGRRDIRHADKSRSHLNQTFIGTENWAAEALEIIQEIRLENFLNEVTARREDAMRQTMIEPEPEYEARLILTNPTHEPPKDDPKSRFTTERPYLAKNKRYGLFSLR